MRFAKGLAITAMASRLRDEDVQRIVERLDGWTGKLTWDRLCRDCYRVIGWEPSRQALSSYSRIQQAYKLAKERVKQERDSTPKPPDLETAQKRIERLEAENQRLKAENQQLLAQFVRWQYNATKYGLSKSHLDESLPTIDRGS